MLCCDCIVSTCPVRVQSAEDELHPVVRENAGLSSFNPAGCLHTARLTAPSLGLDHVQHDAAEPRSPVPPLCLHRHRRSLARPSLHAIHRHATPRHRHRPHRRSSPLITAHRRLFLPQHLNTTPAQHPPSTRPAASRGCHHCHHFTPRGPRIPPGVPAARPQPRALLQHVVPAHLLPTGELRRPAWGLPPPPRLPHHPPAARPPRPQNVLA